MRLTGHDVISIRYKLRSDAGLVELARRGDTGAFDAFVERHQGCVYALVLGLLGHEQDAAVPLRETFVAAYRDLNDAAAVGSPRLWLHRHALRAAFASIHALHGERSRVMERHRSS